jgi:hypothetical protein
MNPYKALAGTELDIQLAQKFFKDEPVEPYSTEARQADRLRKAIEEKFGEKVVFGVTRTRLRLHFARLDENPSTSIEALAETYPLAVARLALVLTHRMNKSARGEQTRA